MSQRIEGRGGDAGSWWDWHLFGVWVLVNGAAFLVIPVVGLLLEYLTSDVTSSLVDDYRWLAVVLIALAGAGTQGVILGRWQWRVLRHRLPELRRLRWVLATLVPAFAVWLVVIAPGAVDLLGRGSSTITAFLDGFVQALVLGPLIGMSQATALRGHTSRWAWWLAANVITYLSGAALHEAAVRLQEALSLPGHAPGFFPVLAIAVHGVWMLWVTAPAAAVGAVRDRRPSRARGGRPGGAPRAVESDDGPVASPDDT